MLKDCGDLRTLGSLENQRLKWMNESGDLKNAKDYGNVVSPSILGSIAPADTLVLDIIPPPGGQTISFSFFEFNLIRIFF